jgi:hypothetical protein
MKKRQQNTRQMPSGAQQYVRGETPAATLQDRINANRGRDPELERRLIDAIKDEDPSARYGDSGTKGSMLLAEPGLPKRRGDPNIRGMMHVRRNEPNLRGAGAGNRRGTKPK